MALLGNNGKTPSHATGRHFTPLFLTLATLLLAAWYHPTAYADLAPCDPSGAITFEYLATPALLSLEPRQGQTGSIVTIHGTNLLGGGLNATRVDFDNKPAERIVFSNETTVVAIVPRRATAGNVTVLVEADTGALLEEDFAFEYTEPGAITSLAPTSGQGGTYVTLVGSRLLGGGTFLMSASINQLAAEILEHNDTHVLLRAAPGPAGFGPIVLTADHHVRVASTVDWTYAEPGFIAAAAPSSGVEGTSLYIFGDNLRGAGTSVQSVTLANRSATILEQTNKFVRVTAPAGPATGNVIGDIVIEADTGAQVIATDAWTFVTPGNITRLEPSKGITNTRVTIFGTDLLSGGRQVIQVRMAGVAANILQYNNSQIVVEAGAAELPGLTGDVVLYIDSGPEVVLENGWTYQIIPGDIFTVEPPVGVGGALVTISGVSLLAGVAPPAITNVTLAGFPVRAVLEESSSQVVVVAGDATGPTSGNIIIEISNGATVRRLNGFRYVEAPVITGVTPSSGQLGTFVDITGVSLLMGTSQVTQVSLATVPVRNIISYNDTLVRVEAAGDPTLGSGPVHLVTRYNATVTNVALNFTYTTPSRIDAVEPAVVHGGSYVTITGSRLTGSVSSVASVRIGSLDATIIEQNDTRVVVRAAPSASASSSPESVTLRAADGALALLANATAYAPPAVIASVTPTSAQTGTTVTVLGTGLLGAGANVSWVQLQGIPVSVQYPVSATRISFVVDEASRTLGTTDLSLQADDGSSIGATAALTLVEDGLIAGVTPAQGAQGTLVTIVGQRLRGSSSHVAHAFLDGVEATLVAENDTAVVIRAAPAPESVSPAAVTLVADSGAVVSADASWTYLLEPQVSAVQPPVGSRGSVVTIVGQGMLAGTTGTADVVFGGVSVANVLSANDTVVVVELNTSHPVGSNNLTISTPSGSYVYGIELFEFLAPGAITAVYPAIGVGSTRVTIEGVSLLGGALTLERVLLAGVEASVLNATGERVVVAAGPSSQEVNGSVIVVATDGAYTELTYSNVTVSMAPAFRYLTPPAVTAVHPGEGTRGSYITLQGVNLLGGGNSILSFRLGGIEVQEVTAFNNTQIVVRVGLSPTALEQVNLTIIADTYARVIHEAAFNYTAPVTITAVTPDRGQAGTLVTLQGINLQGPNAGQITAVSLDGQPSEAILQQNATWVVVRAGANTSAFASGAVQLDTTSGAYTGLADVFHYQPAGIIDNISPAFGQAGTRVTITGERLFGAASGVAQVDLAGTAATIQSASNTEIVVEAGDNVAGLGDVTITALSGAKVTKPDGFEYMERGVVTDVYPTSGQLGTRVTINGTGLFGSADNVSHVRFGDALLVITSRADDQIEGTLPDAPAGVVDVTVFATSGAFAQLVNAFEILERGSVTSLSPAQGVEGARIIVIGTNLLGGGTRVVSLEFGGVAATVLYANETAIEAALGLGPDADTLGDVVIVANTGALISGLNLFTYREHPIVTVLPDSGREGTLVSVSVQGLCRGAPNAVITNVTLVGIPAVFQGAPAGCGQVRVAAGNLDSNVTGDIVVTASNGARAVLPNGFTYVVDGAIISVIPAAGTAGDRVTLRGVSLLAGGSTYSQVFLGGVAATLQNFSADGTWLVVTAGNGVGTGTGDVETVSDSGVRTVLLDGFTYTAITAASPAFGQRGTVITLIGQALLAGGSDVVDVEIAGVDVAEIREANASRLVVVAAELTNSNDLVSDVVVTLDNGQSYTASDIFTYRPTGVVLDVSPTTVAAGAFVNLEGTQLLGYGASLVSATVAGVSATIVQQNTTHVQLRLPAGSASASGVVRLEADTGAIVVSSASVTLTALPTVTGCSPSTGQFRTRVTISGTQLLMASSIVDVQLAGVSVEQIVSASNTEVVVVAADGNADPASAALELFAASGASVAGGAHEFSYVERGAYTHLEPAQGQVGTQVVITGANLFGNSTTLDRVVFGSLDATILAANATFVRVELPANVSAGAVPITLHGNTGAEVTGTPTFELLTAGKVTAVQPSTIHAGTFVTLTGTDLFGGGSLVASARLGGALVASINFANDTTLVVEASTGAEDAQGVQLVADTGAVVEAQPASLLTYVSPAAITAVSPLVGVLGTRVTVAGTSLGMGSSISQANLLASSDGSRASSIVSTILHSQNETHLVFALNSTVAAQAGLDLVLTTAEGAFVRSAIGFSVLPAPVITNVSPAAGTRHTHVTIRGTNLLGGGTSATSVQLAGVEVLAVLGANATQVVVEANEAPDGLSAVVIHANTGAVASAPDAWDQLAASAIDSVEPAVGRPGTRITISGRGLALGSSVDRVTVGGVAARSIAHANSTQVIVTIDDATPVGVQAVEVVADSGAKVSLAGAFEVLVVPVLISVSPAVGVAGTLVTIRGEGLLGGGSVAATISLEGLAVASILSSNASYLVVEAGEGVADSTGTITIVADTGAEFSESGAFTFVANGAVTGVDPVFGQRDTRVTISGTGLLADGITLDSVTLDGVPVQAIISVTSTQVVVQAGSSATSSSPGDVVLRANTGGRIVALASFEYRPAATIDALLPDSGAEGTSFVLVGTNLFAHGTSITQLSLGGRPAAIVRQSNYFVEAVAPLGPPAGEVVDVMLVADTGATAVRTNGWTFVPVPNVTSIVPARGVGGTLITIAGEHLLAGGSDIAEAFLGETQAVVLSASNTSVQLRAQPSLQVGLVNVTLHADNEARIIIADGFEYIEAGQITEVVPIRGQGLTRVTITGDNLLGGGNSMTAVTLAGVPVREIINASDNVVVVVANYSAVALLGSVALTANNGAQVVRLRGFTYVAPTVLTASVPAVGQWGTRVTLTGIELLAGAEAIESLRVGPLEATILTSSQSKVVFVTPQINASITVGVPLDVVLSLAGGAVNTFADRYTYRDAAVIVSVVPAQGLSGALITLNGARLLGGGSSIAQVTLNEVQATVISANNDSIVVQAAAPAAFGTEHVELVADTGARAVLEDAFTYVLEPVLTALTPSSGQAGTLVTINGTGLLGGSTALASVRFDDIDVAIVVASDTQVVVRLPHTAPEPSSGYAVAAPVTLVTLDNGTFAEAARFTWLESGRVDNIDPAVAQQGTRITITGQRLLAGAPALSAVRLGGDACEILTASDTIVGCTSPTLSTPGALNVTLEGTSGATITVEGLLTGVADGIVTVITPGTAQAGTRVTVFGERLLGSSGGGLSALQLASSNITSFLTSNASMVAFALPAEVPAGAHNFTLVAASGARVVSTIPVEVVSAGSITSIAPASGTAGTQVTIRGTALLGGAATLQVVHLAGIAATQIVSANSSMVVVVAGAGTPVPANRSDVRLLATSGALVTKDGDAFQYVATPQITALVPAHGQFGVRVTIQGIQLLAGSSLVAVRVADVLAEIVGTPSDTAIVVALGGSEVADVGVVELETADGAVVTSTLTFAYDTPSTLTTITPAQGQLGTLVTLSGSSFFGVGGVALLDRVIVANSSSNIEVLPGYNASHIIVRLAAPTATTVVDVPADVEVVAANGARTRLVGQFTYLSTGVVTDVVPPVAYFNTRVTITGSRLLGGAASLTAVEIGGVAATLLPGAANSTHVLVRVGPNTPSGSADVRLLADSGAVVELASAVIVANDSSIDGVHPRLGHAGTRVTITGTKLRSAGTAVVAVKLDGVLADITSESDTEVVVVAGASSAGTGDVVLESDTGATLRYLNGWEYGAPGVINAVNPTSGVEGTRVTITGTNLLGHDNALSAVYLGTYAGTVLPGANATYVVVRAAPGPPQAITGAVSLVAHGGAHVETAGQDFEYKAPGVASFVTPTTGQVGVQVQIFGTNLCGYGDNLSSVSLAGTIAQLVSVDEACTTVTVIAGDAGYNASGPAELVADTGAITRGAMFSYIAAGEITAVQPEAGSAGASITITGSNLFAGSTGINSVQLFGVTAATIDSASDTEIVVTAGSLGAGVTSAPGDVVINTRAGVQIRRPLAFTYSQMQSITPDSGMYGTRVTVNGVGLLGGSVNSAVSAVKVDGRLAELMSSNDTRVVFALAAASLVTDEPSQIVFELPNGQTVASSAEAFLYKTPGQISAVTPAVGAENTRVVLTGSNLNGYGGHIENVTLAGVPVKRIEAQNSSHVVVIAAAGAANTGDIVIQAESGATVIRSNGFTYVTPGSIASVEPARGQAGAVVNITGVDLLSGASSLYNATVANVPVTAILSATPTFVQVELGMSALAVTGTVVLTGIDGATTTGGSFEYVAPGRIDALVPARGYDGALVAVHGEGLLLGSTVAQVVVGGVAATLVNATDDAVYVRLGSGMSAGAATAVINAASGASVELSSAFDVVVPPRIDVVSPAQGVAGTLVTIRGSGFFLGGTGLISAHLGAIDLVPLVGPIVTVLNDTHIVLRLPSAGAGAVNLALVSNAGADAVLADVFTYLTPSSISAISPATGRFGTLVTITGSLLGNGSTAAAVSVAGVAAIVLRASDAEIVVKLQAPIPSEATPSGAVFIRADTQAEFSGGSFAYTAAGLLQSVSPSRGVGGTVVTLSGSDLLGGGALAASVSLGNVTVASIESANETSIVVVVGEADNATLLAASPVAVHIEADTGAAFTSATPMWTYVPRGIIETVVPAEGAAGTLVTLSGSGLFNGAAGIARADLGGAEATVISATEQEVVVRVPVTASPNALASPIILTTVGGATVSKADAFVVLPPAAVESLTPTSVTLGTRVTVQGTDLLGGGSDATTVFLNGVEAREVLLANATLLVFVAGLGGVADNDHLPTLELFADTGAHVMVNHSSTAYVVPGAIDVVTPAIGQQGTIVTIAGTNLLPDAASPAEVLLAGQVTEVQSFNGTLIVVRIPVGATAAVGDVLLRTVQGGEVKAPAAFEVGLPPQIVAISPEEGVLNTQALIFGTALRVHGSRVTRVLLGTHEAEILSETDRFVSIRVPNGTAGVVDVRIEADLGGYVVQANAWRFLSPPVIESIEPSSGQRGTIIELRGTGLLAGAAAAREVTLAGTPARVLALNNTYARLEAGLGTTLPRRGDVVIRLETGATVVRANGFEYVPVSDVNAVTPAVGQGGTIVTIRGTSLLGGGSAAVNVTVVGQAVRQVVRANATEIVVQLAFLNVTTRTQGDIFIMADTGATVLETDGFTYEAPASIASVHPALGQIGTRVTIEGQYLLAGGSSVAVVTLDGVPARVVSSTNSRVVVVANASASASAMAGDVEVVAQHGSSATKVAAWTFAAPSEVTSVAPGQGQLGTRLIVVGTGLLGGGGFISTATVGDLALTVVSSNDSFVELVVPAAYSAQSSADVVLEADTGAQTTAINAFELLPPATITDISPIRGQLGTLVTIMGSNLLAASTAVQASVGGIDADVVSASDSMIVVQLHNGTAAPLVPIRVTMASGAYVESESVFEYLSTGHIASVSPARGQVGALVTIAGTRLQGGATGPAALAAVRLAAVPAQVVFFNDTLIVAQLSAANDTPTGNVSILAATGAIVESTAAAVSFSYAEPAVVTAVEPADGVAGTLVTIHGISLRNGATAIQRVLLANQTVDSIEYENETLVVVRVAAHTDGYVGIGDVVLENADGAWATAANAFAYLAPPDIVAVSPATGQSQTFVTIIGTGLLGGAAALDRVLLDGVVASNIVFANDTTVLVRAGTAGAASMTPGSVEIYNAEGAMVILENAFAYASPPAVTSIEPPSGQWGTFVTIRGSNLLAGGTELLSLQLGTVAAFEIQSYNDTMIVLRAGQHATAMANVSLQVETDTGAQYGLPEAFSYDLPSNISQVSTEC
ncbi:uncharacterized protein MONBRDRAFT_29861 [Monosiga brevicollis MX1]|uniref:IPT/TIG domain-containing protein n=1 Tax=Monosiga brevicollis TaxID=81824 RepID=A9VCC3_MONBE|nr:uncharacterized protein MONBRDRAFT_29861 [Monosiga brevicollis MX1]EDQ84874.1 predicted protein [Monosiga brevicollis MX1]|eukprot:XP_001750375.1 hypothetical protein [Monosiga brevicollis MX1]